LAFPKSRPGQKPSQAKGQAWLGPAFFGSAWLGFWLQAGAGTSLATTTISEPRSTSQVDADTSAAITTHISFFDFITMATTEDIKKFLKLASTTPEGGNLENLWRRAHIEGYEKGRKNMEKNMEDRFEEGVRKGMDLGHEEGYTVAKEAFDDIIKVVKAREAPKVDTTNAGTQTDTPTTTATSVSTQTSTLHTTGHPTTDAFVQTNPTCTQTSCHNVNLKHPLSSPTHTSVIPSASTATIGIQTETITSQHHGIGSPTLVATSHSLGFSGNRKKLEISTTKAITSENSQNTTIFSPPKPSVTSSDSTTLLTTTPALETRQKTAECSPKVENVDFSPYFTKTTPQTPSLSTCEHSGNMPRVHSSQQAPNNTFIHPTTPSTTANSSSTQYLTGHEKSASLCAVFEPQSHTESPEPTTIVPALKTRLATADFTENCQKLEKHPNFTQKTPESLISKRFSWADDANELPTSYIAPTKYARDLSSLRSSISQKKSFFISSTSSPEIQQK
jgi:hypothetical protein